MEDYIRNTARLIGIIGFFLFGTSIFIGSTLRLLDKKFGLDRLLRFHRLFSLISFLILIFHPILLFIYNFIKYNFLVLEIYLNYFKLYYFIFGVISLIFLAINIFLSYFFFKKINHLFWLIFHRFSVIFYIISLIHLLNFGVLIGLNPKIPILNIVIIFSIILALIGVIIRSYLLIKNKKITSRVTNIIKETDETYTILIEKPKNFTYKAGQFAFINFKKKKMTKPHPFTISSSPSEDFLSFSIKSLGEFTSKIKTINNNEIIKIDGPYGIFNFKNRDSIFIAGGIGITPFRSIIGDKDFNKDNKKVILLYGSKTKKDIIFYDWFEKNKDKLKIVYILSNERIVDDSKNNFEYGFLSDDILKKYSDFTEDFYICGPPIMVKKTIEILKSNNVNKIKIFYEKFLYLG